MRGDENRDESVDVTPVDLDLVYRDDAFLEAIAAGRYPDSDDPDADLLADMLVTWRAELVESPIPEGPSVDDAATAISGSARRRARKIGIRRLQLVAGAAAACAVVFGGVSTAAYTANPGDPLWGVKQAMFAEQAQQTAVAVDVRGVVTAGDDALQVGKVDVAKAKVKEAQDRLPEVTGTDRDLLQQRIDGLKATIEAYEKAGKAVVGRPRTATVTETKTVPGETKTETAPPRTVTITPLPTWETPRTTRTVTVRPGG